MNCSTENDTKQQSNAVTIWKMNWKELEMRFVIHLILETLKLKLHFIIEIA